MPQQPWEKTDGEIDVPVGEKLPFPVWHQGRWVRRELVSQLPPEPTPEPLRLARVGLAPGDER